MAESNKQTKKKKNKQTIYIWAVEMEHNGLIYISSGFYQPVFHKY